MLRDVQPHKTWNLTDDDAMKIRLDLAGKLGQFAPDCFAAIYGQPKCRTTEEERTTAFQIWYTRKRIADCGPGPETESASTTTSNQHERCDWSVLPDIFGKARNGASAAPAPAKEPDAVAEVAPDAEPRRKPFAQAPNPRDLPPLVSDPKYERPTPEEVQDALKGSPLYEFCKEEKKISDEIPFQFRLLDSIYAAGLILANRGVRIGNWKDDYDALFTNIYGMKIGSSGSGKGRTSRFIAETVLKLFSIPAIRGESESAIVNCAKTNGAEFGSFYVPEVNKIINRTSVTASQLCNWMVAAWDEKRMGYSTRPKGQACTLELSPAAPSVLVDGQPGIIEGAGDKSLANAGFMARFLIAFPGDDGHDRARRMKIGVGPDRARIAEAYAPFVAATAGTIMREPHEPDCRGERFWPRLTEDERSAWSRLAGEYVPKIALMLDPAALKTGKIEKAALDRAAVICDWFLADSIKALGLLHDDPFEKDRIKASRYVHANPGFPERAVYRYMRCSITAWSIISKTLMARGEIFSKADPITKETCWYPVRNAGL